MSTDPGCARARELFSDHADGSLHEILKLDFERHLDACAECRALHEAFLEVVSALRSHPALEPSADLAERVAERSLLRARALGSVEATARPGWPRVLRIAAAIVLVASGATLMAAGPNQAATRTAQRWSDRAGNAIAYLGERKDRVVEDVRILRVVIAAAFEGRLDRVNDRFDDYRKLLERRATSSERPSPKKSEGKQSNSARADLVRRCEAWKEQART